MGGFCFIKDEAGTHRIEVNLFKVSLPRDLGLEIMGHFRIPWGVVGSVEAVWVIPFFQARIIR